MYMYMYTMNMLLLCLFYHLLDGDKTSQFEMKLMDIDSEHLGIPVSYVININTCVHTMYFKKGRTC